MVLCCQFWDVEIFKMSKIPCFPRKYLRSKLGSKKVRNFLQVCKLPGPFMKNIHILKHTSTVLYSTQFILYCYILQQFYETVLIQICLNSANKHQQLHRRDNGLAYTRVLLLMYQTQDTIHLLYHLVLISTNILLYVLYSLNDGHRQFCRKVVLSEEQLMV